MAQEAGTADVAVALGHSISTKVVTLKIDNQRGEPHLFPARAKFDRPVPGVLGGRGRILTSSSGTTEKYINRQLFQGIDHVRQARSNGTELEVSGKLGIRDGSGDWDDTPTKARSPSP